MGARCCTAPAELPPAKPPQQQQDVAKRVQLSLRGIREGMRVPIVCDTQSRDVHAHIVALADAIRAGPAAPFRAETVLGVVHDITCHVQLCRLLPLRSATIGVLLALNGCAAAVALVRSCAFRDSCVGLLRGFSAREYFASGWEEYTCARVRLVAVIQSQWPAAAQEFAGVVDAASTVLAGAPCNRAASVLRQRLLRGN